MENKVNKRISKKKETWATLPMDTLTKIYFGHPKENGLWFGFLALNRSEESDMAFNQLHQRIARHMSRERPARIADLRRAKKGQVFILKYKDEFVRAKIQPVTAENFVRFLLLDLGYFINLRCDRFSRPDVFAIAEELVQALPFQTIYCKLTGVDLFEAAVDVKLVGRDLYAVGKRTCRPAFRGVKMHGYEILLYETNPNAELRNASLFNKRLVQLGVACANARTSGDLDAVIANIIDDNQLESSMLFFQQCCSPQTASKVTTVEVTTQTVE